MNIDHRNPRSRRGAAVVFCRVAEEPIDVVLQTRHDVPRLMSHYVSHGESPRVLGFRTAALPALCRKTRVRPKKQGAIRKIRVRKSARIPDQGFFCHWFW